MMLSRAAHAWGQGVGTASSPGPDRIMARDTCMSAFAARETGPRFR